MRIILCELSRVIDHIIAVGTGALDLGALTAFFHFFTYREKCYNLFEKLCGSRLTVSLTRVGEVDLQPVNGSSDELPRIDEQLTLKDALSELIGLGAEKGVVVSK